MNLFAKIAHVSWYVADLSSLPIKGDAPVVVMAKSSSRIDRLSLKRPL